MASPCVPVLTCAFMLLHHMNDAGPLKKDKLNSDVRTGSNDMSFQRFTSTDNSSYSPIQNHAFISENLKDSFNDQSYLPGNGMEKRQSVYHNVGESVMPCYNLTALEYSEDNTARHNCQTSTDSGNKNLPASTENHQMSQALPTYNNTKYAAEVMTQTYSSDSYPIAQAIVDEATNSKAGSVHLDSQSLSEVSDITTAGSGEAVPTMDHMISEQQVSGNPNHSPRNLTAPTSATPARLSAGNGTEAPDMLQTTNTTEGLLEDKGAAEGDTLQELERNPEVRPGLFEGDMVLDTEENNLWRVGLRRDMHGSRLWINNTVPYVISPLYEPEDYVTIYKAITMLNFMTCIKFVPWDGKAKDYVVVWPVQYPKGCWSHVGRTGGAQLVSLQPPDDHSTNCLGGEGRVLHELLHTLGIFHEQARADRDAYVQIHPENISRGFKKNFRKQSLENTTYAFEYDYNSIMHYGKYFFSKKRGKPTITAKLGKKTRIGQRRGLSKTDCLKVNHLYDCLKTRRYYTLCSVLGL